jgi:hypothetical protein
VRDSMTPANPIAATINTKASTLTFIALAIDLLQKSSPMTMVINLESAQLILSQE